jgi:hypothetical protein
MLEDIRECFVRGQEQMMAHLGGQRMRRQGRCDVQFALDPGHLEILLRILPDVRGHMLQCVILRIHRPDNFIQRMEHFPRCVGNRGDLVPQFVGRKRPPPRVFAQEGNPAELGAHFVVQIPGDAGAFPFKRALLFQTLQPALKFSLLHEMHGRHD